jgi:hypothetical protein
VTNKRSAWIGIGVPLVLALVLLVVAPAAAHHKSGHENGGGKGKGGGSSSGATEDNDSNDNDTPNNLADDGDNAHPSGKDKSIEHGNSGNQGNSTSDPDDDGRGPDRSNGGADKPDGPGGVDLADQDGNNGCGNDDDFEDDNEGWCGKKPKPEREVGDDTTDDTDDSDDETIVDDETTDDDSKECPDDALMTGVICDAISDVIDTDRPSRDVVLGERVERPATPTTLEVSDDTVVASETAERSATLPFTGAGMAKLLFLAGGLIVLGALMLVARRRSHATF